MEDFQRAGVKLIQPGCGACIGCGPGVSENSEQVSISAINRNFKGRSGPGKLYLASPLSVAASAFTGYITAYEPGMFSGQFSGRSGGGLAEAEGVDRPASRPFSLW